MNVKPLILVPNSSPERPGVPTSYIPHQSHFTQHTYGHGVYPLPYMQQMPVQPQYVARPVAKMRQPQRDSLEERPRKRQNVGPSGANMHYIDSPMSTPVRNPPQNGMISVFGSDEESPGPNRIRRGRPDDYVPPLANFANFGPPVMMNQTPAPIMPLAALAATFPNMLEADLHDALAASGGIYNTAVNHLRRREQFLERSVAQLREQEQREKELAKNRKNKSAIYNNRNAVPPLANFEPMVHQAPPRRNPNLSDSDEDDFRGGDDSEASDGEDRTNDSELEAVCAAEALEYFNTADAEGLVMMIG